MLSVWSPICLIGPSGMRIAERGTHRELLERAGTYAQMWALQQQEKNATEQAAITDPLAFAG